MNKVNKFNGFKEAGRVIERVIRGEDFLFYRKMIILSSRNVFPFPLFLLSIRRSKKFLPITDNATKDLFARVLHVRYRFTKLLCALSLILIQQFTRNPTF